MEHLIEYEKWINNIINESINYPEFQMCLDESLTNEQETEIDKAVNIFMDEYNSGKDLDQLIDEGLLGSVLGGLTGFALGKSIGTVIARVLGVQKGILYDLLTSRLVGAALGSSLGKKI